MAIKGKSKSRGTKTVARGPKPVYVPVKTPWYRRRGLWLVVATLVAVAAVEGLVYGFVNQSNENKIKDDQSRLAAVTNRYRGVIQPILATVGSETPPSGFAAFPSLDSGLAGLETDTVDQNALDAASNAADSTVSTARSAIGNLGDVDAATMVGGKGFSRSYVLYVLNSEAGFVRGLKLFREAAVLLSLAVEAGEGPGRADLVAQARSVQAIADETFSTAYSDYVQAQILANVFQPSGPGTITPITGPTGATGPATGASG